MASVYFILIGAGAAGVWTFFTAVAGMRWYTDASAPYQSFVPLLERIPPGRLVASLTQQRTLTLTLDAAGIEYPWSLASLLAVKRVALWGVILCALILSFVFPVPRMILLWILLPLLYAAVRGPEIYVHLRVKQRRARVERELPRFMDALLFYVRAGLNLEAACRALTPRLQGEWGLEWRRAVVALDHGMRFSDVLARLVRRFDSAEFRRLSTVLEQSRVLGVPLTDVLAMHADLLRTRRLQRASERAKSAAVKISIPLIFCIFPALMIVFLAPAVLHLMQSF